MVGGGQPRLEEAPEALHGEGLWRASVEHPQDARKDEADSEPNRCEEDDQGAGAWSERSGVDASDGGGGDVPVVASSTVSTVDGVAVDGHLDVEVVGCGGRPFKGPRANRVGFVGVGKAPVHYLTVGFWDRRNVAVRGKNTVATGSTVPVDVVDFHDVIFNGHSERVGFAGVVGLRKAINQHRGVGRGSTVTGTALITG